MIEIEVDSSFISQAFGIALLAIDDLSPAMEQIGEMLIVSTRKRIEDGVSPEGVPFAPKSPTTIKNYLKQGFHKGAKAGPLIRTGDMLSMSLHSLAGSDYVEVASSALQAAVMHFGAPKGSLGAYSGTNKKGHLYSGLAPWGNIPARPFLGLSDDDRTNIIDVIAKHVFGTLKGDR